MPGRGNSGLTGHGHMRHGTGDDGQAGRRAEPPPGREAAVDRPGLDPSVGSPDPDDPGGLVGQGLSDALGSGPGRSADAPGHRKQAAGARSARDFAPGRAGSVPRSSGGREAQRDEG